jgi:hypothetical protein
MRNYFKATAIFVSVLLCLAVVVVILIVQNGPHLDSFLPHAKSYGYHPGFDATSGCILGGPIDWVRDFYDVSKNGLTLIERTSKNLILPTSKGNMSVNLSYLPSSIPIPSLMEHSYGLTSISFTNNPGIRGYCSTRFIEGTNEQNMLLLIGEGQILPASSGSAIAGSYMVDLSTKPAVVRKFEILSDHDFKEANFCTDQRHLFYFSNDAISVFDFQHEIQQTVNIPAEWQEDWQDLVMQETFGIWQSDGTLKLAIVSESDKTIFKKLSILDVNFNDKVIRLDAVYSWILLSEDYRGVVISDHGFKLFRLDDMTTSDIITDQGITDFENSQLFLSPDFRYAAFSELDELFIADLIKKDHKIISKVYKDNIFGQYSFSFLGFINADYVMLDAGKLNKEIYYKVPISDFFDKP